MDENLHMDEIKNKNKNQNPKIHKIIINYMWQIQNGPISPLI
jgi:ribosomal protein L5